VKRGVYFDGWKWDVDWVGGGADVICGPYTRLRVLIGGYSIEEYRGILVHLRTGRLEI
jgi:hypothetical protein